MEKKEEPMKIIEIPVEVKGLVFGKGKKNLKQISTSTGARVFCYKENVGINGTEEAIRKATLEVKRLVVRKYSG